MGPTWVLSAPDGPHIDPMNLAIRVNLCTQYRQFSVGYRQFSVGYRQFSVGYRQFSVGYRQFSVGYLTSTGLIKRLLKVRDVTKNVYTERWKGLGLVSI